MNEGDSMWNHNALIGALRMYHNALVIHLNLDNSIALITAPSEVHLLSAM